MYPELLHCQRKQNKSDLFPELSEPPTNLHVYTISMWSLFSLWSSNFYNYTYPGGRIVSRFIMHPGNVLATGVSTDLDLSNFTFVAEHFGLNQPFRREGVQMLAESALEGDH